MQFAIRKMNSIEEMAMQQSYQQNWDMIILGSMSLLIGESAETEAVIYFLAYEAI